MLGIKKLDYKVDVFAFAMIAFEVAYNVKPWNQVPMDDIEALVKSGKRPELGSGDQTFADLITRCWCQKPEARLSFNQILEYLSNFGDNDSSRPEERFSMQFIESEITKSFEASKSLS